mmetsp:Transcript_9670/g.22569  ORF Transcript_9670/g.22569 Transcript_9670/m.22569 type:complete len:221 (-) Transcript_9670:595-1257(-)
MMTMMAVWARTTFAGPWASGERPGPGASHLRQNARSGTIATLARKCCTATHTRRRSPLRARHGHRRTRARRRAHLARPARRQARQSRRRRQDHHRDTNRSIWNVTPRIQSRITGELSRGQLGGKRASDGMRRCQMCTPTLRSGERRRARTTIVARSITSAPGAMWRARRGGTAATWDRLARVDPARKPATAGLPLPARRHRPDRRPRRPPRRVRRPRSYT